MCLLCRTWREELVLLIGQEETDKVRQHMAEDIQKFEAENSGMCISCPNNKRGPCYIVRVEAEEKTGFALDEAEAHAASEALKFERARKAVRFPAGISALAPPPPAIGHAEAELVDPSEEKPRAPQKYWEEADVEFSRMFEDAQQHES